MRRKTSWDTDSHGYFEKIVSGENKGLRNGLEKRMAMSKNEDLKKLAMAVKDLFRVKLREFRSEDFIEVAGLLGFHADEKRSSGKTVKLVAEYCLPDIIGTNLQYAVDAYAWETHVPMTEDGIIVSDFWDRSKDEGVPDGYMMDAEGKFLRKKG